MRALCVFMLLLSCHDNIIIVLPHVALGAVVRGSTWLCSVLVAVCCFYCVVIILPLLYGWVLSSRSHHLEPPSLF